MPIKLTTIIKNLTEVIPEFPRLPVSKRSWLINMYTRNYTAGVKALNEDTFSNPGYVTYQDLMERLKEYPEVSVHETEFMHRLAEGDDVALNEVLDESETLDDFVYTTYEENYSDWVPKAVEKTLKEIPDGLDKYDLDLLAQEAFAQGITWKIDYLAKQQIIKYAKNIIREQEG